MRLTLLNLSPDRVTFELEHPKGQLRLVTVEVGSGRTWFEATRYPNLGLDSGSSTGNEALDLGIRRRAAEELIRLDAARHG